jgi:hypothetical protein
VVLGNYKVRLPSGRLNISCNDFLFFFGFAAEIDRTLKKVEEGVEIFNEIWDKVAERALYLIPKHQDSVPCNTHPTANPPGVCRKSAEPKRKV